MRDSVRRVIDNAVEVEDGMEVLPHDVEVAFNAVYDKFLRASDELDLARDLVAGVRPTFIVGLYGQNFVDIPELLDGTSGYAFSWGVIVVTTLLQLWWFRRKRWF